MLNKFHIVVLVVIAASVALPGNASMAYWTSQNKEPIFIVIGKVGTISQSTFERSRDADPKPAYNFEDGIEYKIIDTFSCGLIKVENTLWGDTSISEIPIRWHSGNHYRPEVKELGISISTIRSFDDGDMRIWVIWNSEDFQVENEISYHGFQALSLTYLEKVKTDIKEYLE